MHRALCHRYLDPSSLRKGLARLLFASLLPILLPCNSLAAPAAAPPPIPCTELQALSTSESYRATMEDFNRCHQQGYDLTGTVISTTTHPDGVTASGSDGNILPSVPKPAAPPNAKLPAIAETKQKTTDRYALYAQQAAKTSLSFFSSSSSTPAAAGAAATTPTEKASAASQATAIAQKAAESAESAAAIAAAAAAAMATTPTKDAAAEAIRTATEAQKQAATALEKATEAQTKVKAAEDAAAADASETAPSTTTAQEAAKATVNKATAVKQQAEQALAAATAAETAVQAAEAATATASTTPTPEKLAAANTAKAAAATATATAELAAQDTTKAAGTATVIATSSAMASQTTYASENAGGIKDAGETSPLQDTPSSTAINPENGLQEGILMGKSQELTSNTLTTSCGAAIPLSHYLMSLNKDADYFAITHYNAPQNPHISVYKRNDTGGFSIIQDADLPKSLERQACKRKWYGRKKCWCVKTVDLTDAYPQIITFRGDEKKISLRLMPPDTQEGQTHSSYPPITVTVAAGASAPTEAELEAKKPAEPASYQDDPNAKPISTIRYFDLPIQHTGGTLQLMIPPPTGCQGSPQYDELYRETGDSGADITIEPPLKRACEASKNICNDATNTIGNFMITPKTGKIGTAIPKGGSACKAATQFFVQDRPNLVFPPATKIESSPVVGSPMRMVKADHASLYVNDETSIVFNTYRNRYTLPDGGTLTLNNNQSLVMYAPATMDMAQKKLVLTGGGSIQNAQGVAQETYPADSSSNIQASASGSKILGGTIDMNGTSLALTPISGTDDEYDVEVGSLKLGGNQHLILTGKGHYTFSGSEEDSIDSFVLTHGAQVKDDAGTPEATDDTIIATYAAGSDFPPNDIKNPTVTINGTSFDLTPAEDADGNVILGQYTMTSCSATTPCTISLENSKNLSLSDEATYQINPSSGQSSLMLDHGGELTEVDGTVTNYPPNTTVPLTNVVPPLLVDLSQLEVTWNYETPPVPATGTALSLPQLPAVIYPMGRIQLPNGFELPSIGLREYEVIDSTNITDPLQKQENTPVPIYREPAGMNN